MFGKIGYPGRGGGVVVGLPRRPSAIELGGSEGGFESGLLKIGIEGGRSLMS